MTQVSELKRTLSLTLITLYGLGTILGAGIYVLVGEVGRSAGLYAPVAFLIAAVLAALSGLSYAELAARFPRSAGEALYVQQGLGRPSLAVIVGWGVILVGTVSAATVARGSVGYLLVLVSLPGWLLVTALILLLGAIAAWGIRESIAAAAAMTLVEVFGLLLIIAVAGDSLVTLPQRLPELLPPLEGSIWQGILFGAFLAFFAFIGFEDMVNVAEEVRDPTRTLPRAILLAIGVTTVLYVVVALTTVLTLPPAVLAGSDAPLALLYESATGGAPWLISAISVVAIINGALIQIVMASRMLYGMSREGWQAPVFARVHPRTRTPVIATATITMLVLVLALWLPLVTLAQVTSFVVLIVFSVVNLALARIKRREPHPPGVRPIPSWVPLAGFAASGAFVIYQLLLWLGR